MSLQVCAAELSKRFDFQAQRKMEIWRDPSSVQIHLDCNPDEVGVIFSAELGLQHGGRVGDRFIGDAEFGRDIRNAVATTQKSQDLEFARAHLRQRTGVDRRAREGRCFGQARRNEAPTGCNLPDGLGQEPGIIGLRNISLNAHLYSARHERRILTFAEQDDLGGRISLADSPGQLEAGKVGEPHINHRDVGTLLQIRTVALLCTGSLQDLDGRVRREQGPAARYDNGMVVDDQHPHVILVLIARPYSHQLRKRRGRWNSSISGRYVVRSERLEQQAFVTQGHILFICGNGAKAHRFAPLANAILLRNPQVQIYLSSVAAETVSGGALRRQATKQSMSQLVAPWIASLRAQ